MYLWIGRNCNPNFLTQVLGVPSYAAVPDNLVGSPCCSSHEKPAVVSAHFSTFCIFLADDENLSFFSYSICSQSWTLPSRSEPGLSSVG